MKKCLPLSFLLIIGAASWLLFSSFNAPKAEAQTIPTSGLVAHWSFDEGAGTNAGDASGNGHLGILTNGPTWTTGVLGSALNLDGVNDYVNVGTTPSVRGLAQYTLSAWVNLNAVSPAVIYSETTPNSTFRLRLMIVSPTSLELSGRAGDGAPFVTFAQCSSGFTLSVGTWAHIAAVFDSLSDVHSLYVNGVACANNVLAVSAVSNTVPNNAIRIGSQFNNVNWLNGKIDEVRLYNRALTPAEVLSLYNAGTLPPSFDFSVANSGNITLTPGQSGQTTVTATLVSAPTQSTSFSVSGLPSNTTATFSQTACSPTCSTNLTLSTLASTPTGNYTITVTAVGGSLTRTTSFTFTVNVPSPGIPGLVAHWSFDEGAGTSAGDASGNGHLGILTNGPTWTTGVLGSALNLDGVNDYVNVGTTPSVRGLAQYTLSAWVNLNAVSPAVIYSETTPNSTFRLRLMIVSPTSLELSGRAGDGAPFVTFAQCSSGFTLSVGTWAHIAAVFDSLSDVHSLYVNGVACANNVLAVSAVSNTVPNNAIRIGSQFNNVNWLNGKIDEVRLYNRALTPAEVLSLYNAGTLPPSFDFSVANSGNITLTPGQSGQTTVTATLVSAPTQSTSFSVSGLPSNTTATFSQTACSPTCSTNLTLSTLASTPTGNYTITVTAVGGSLTRTTSFTLAVNTSPVFDFALANSGNITLAQGQSGQTTVTATLVSAPTQSTSFSVSGLPSNTTATFSQTACSPTCSTNLTLSTLASTPTGNYTITVTAVGGSLTRTTSFTFTVNVPSPGIPGLVAHWTFDEGLGTIAGDSSGNGNTGILTNGPTWTTGGALSLDGVNDWVNAGTRASLNPSGAITISSWINLRGLSKFQKIVARHNTALKYALGIDITNKVILQINSGSTSAIIGNTALSANIWYHVVGTWNGSNMNLYLNGVSDAAPVAKTGTMAPDSETVSIGARANGSQHFMNGFLDDLRIYNRALSATEVQSLYTAGPSGTPPPPPPPSQIGQMAGPFTWPIVGIHMVLLHTGEVLAWGRGHGGLSAHVWNLTTGAFTSVPNNFTDLFCAGHTHLPDGRILVVGGDDSAAGILGDAGVNIFDPVTRNWTAAPPMAFRRWYPTATTLSDGRVLVTSGADTCFRCIVPIPEIYDPQSNSWTQLAKANLAVPFYPYMFLLPGGQIVDAGADEASVITRVLNVATQTWATVDPVAVDGGSAAMYLPGKIVKSGTSTELRDLAPASATTYVLDMNQPLPTWQQTPSMNFPRVFHTLTLLPDGNVLATGGSRIASSFDTSQAVLEIEMWSPASETWTTLASMQVPRLYHSTALLLPDARVLIAGSGGSDGPDQLNAEIYSPPYLFNGPRPTITSAPATITYGTAFTAGTPEALNITKVSLVAPGAVTHTFDQNQRILDLTFQANPSGLTVQAPTNPNLAPPGYYMLFILDTNGVPSVARFIRLQ